MKGALQVVDMSFSNQKKVFLMYTKRTKVLIPLWALIISFYIPSFRCANPQLKCYFASTQSNVDLHRTGERGFTTADPTVLLHDPDCAHTGTGQSYMFPDPRMIHG